jgi:D-3-phosphoglycerate dehydrogenase
LFQEPPPADHPLFSLPNVVITSHTAGADTLAINDMAIAATQNIIDLYEGRWPEESMVNPELRDGWKWHR